MEALGPKVARLFLIASLAYCATGCLGSKSGSEVPLDHRPGDPSSLFASVLQLADGDAQSAQVATALPVKLRARILNSLGQPLAGESVQFVTASGSLSQATVATDANGYAETTWTLGTVAGAQSVTASIQSGSISGSFSANATPGPVASLAFQTQPAASDVDVALATAPKVRALDAYGNVVTTYGSSITLSLQTNPAAATLGGTATVPAVNGVATFSSLTLDRGAVGYRFAATDGTRTVNSALFNVRCAPILDSIAAPSVAYSLRKLRSAYSGAAFRARRADGAQMDIGFDAANCGFDESALLTFTGSSDAFIQTWYDQTTTANHVVQTTDAFQPRIVTGGVIEKENARNVLRFLGNEFLPGAALAIPSTSGHAYSIVLRPVTYTNGNSNDGVGTYFLDRTTATNNLSSLKASGGKFMYQKRTDAGTGLGGITTATSISTTAFQRVLVERQRGVQYRLYVNGSLEASPADGDSDTTVPALQIGRHCDTPSVYNVGITEVIVWSNPQTPADRNALDANQAKYF